MSYSIPLAGFSCPQLRARVDSDHCVIVPAPPEGSAPVISHCLGNYRPHCSKEDQKRASSLLDKRRASLQLIYQFHAIFVIHDCTASHPVVCWLKKALEVDTRGTRSGQSPVPHHILLQKQEKKKKQQLAFPAALLVLSSTGGWQVSKEMVS